MTEPGDTGSRRRAPLVFDASDPALIVEQTKPEPVLAPTGQKSSDARGERGAEAERADQLGVPNAPVDAARRFRPGWMSLFIASAMSLAGLAAGLAFAMFVSDVLARSDWIGMTGWALLALAVLALVVLAGREIVGLIRLGRLTGIRRDAESALRSRDTAAERAAVRRLRSALGKRPSLAWASARFAEHEGDVRDPGDLLRLADRELVAPLDVEARRLILSSAKRVSLVTAMSPIALIAVGFVLTENLGLLRKLAALYGGRPGYLGSMRLARMVFVHILATGGIALTDDLIGQFIGQDLARRLSRRLGEGLFNGALTARIGVAALDVCRPLPFVESKPVRIRDILAELTRRAPAAKR